MNYTYAIIAGGTVVNVIAATPNFVNQYYSTAVRIDNLVPQPGIGWTYNGSTFTAP